VFIAGSTIGYSTPTYSNRIVLLSEYDLGSVRLSSYPADRAGLKSGDRIVAADDKPISDFSDLLERITLSANKPIALKIERDGILYYKTVTPMLDKDTGGGLIGVAYWADPIVGEVTAGSAAQIAGIESGDRVISIDGKEVHHAIEAFSLLNSAKPERTKIVIERGGSRRELNVILSWNSQGLSNLGLGFKTETHTVRAAANFGAAVSAGMTETWATFNATLKGLGSLFQGVNLLKALSGPARITYMVGQSAAMGIQRFASGGLAVPLSFLAFLSIGLFIMNLLPIPALDGGQIVMFVVEGARRKSLRPITIYRYQFIGATFILAIFVIATVGDLLFFVAK
jgi:regulator of sigma E protease